MDHVAIMKKSWGLLPKILSGKKKIESRWLINKSTPWGKVQPGDTVYFKNSGEKVCVRAKVRKVLEFENLNREKIREMLDVYGEGDGIENADLKKYFNLFKDKKYCLLIFLKNPEKIVPFEINKKGYGAMAAWMYVDDIRIIKAAY